MSESLRFEGDSRQRRRRGVLAQADSLAPSLPIINPDRLATAFPPMVLLTERSSTIYLDVLIAERASCSLWAQSGWLSLNAGKVE